MFEDAEVLDSWKFVRDVTHVYAAVVKQCSVDVVGYPSYAGVVCHTELIFSDRVSRQGKAIGIASVLQSSVCLSVRSTLSFELTFEPHFLYAHDHSLPGIESQGYRSRIRVDYWLSAVIVGRYASIVTSSAARWRVKARRHFMNAVTYDLGPVAPISVNCTVSWLTDFTLLP